MKEQRRLAAIMFTDISGYSALMSADEKQAMAILRKNRSIHKAAVARFNGEYIKEIGDGTLAIFQSSLDAVNCAFRIIKSCCKESGLSVRIGIHIGDIVFKDGDVFGDGVNVASRIEAVGQAGGVFVSERVYEDIKNKPGIRAEFCGRKMLKNITEPANIYQILPEGAPLGKVIAKKKIRILQGQPTRSNLQKVFQYALPLLVFFSAASFVIYQEFIIKNRQAFYRAKGEISVAVLPFQNLTRDSSKDFWEIMIQDNLINSLSNEKDLKVRQMQSVITMLENHEHANYASLTPALARSISQKLDANVFVQGSINQIGEIIRLNAKLIDSKTEEVFKSFQLDGLEENIIQLSDSLTMLVNNFLIVTILKKEISLVHQYYLEFEKITPDPEALKLYFEGLNAFINSNYPEARKAFLSALEINPDFVAPPKLLPFAYGNDGNITEGKKWAKILMENTGKLSRGEVWWAKYTYAFFFETPEEQIKYCRQGLDLDDQLPIAYSQMGIVYSNLRQYNNAIPAFEKNLELLKKWGTKPEWAFHYTNLGFAYHKTGQYRKEQKLYKQAEKDFPDNPSIIRRQAILALVRGKTKQADEYLQKFESIIRNDGDSEAIIQTRLAWIYHDAEMKEKAEAYFRLALLLDTENPWRMRNLAYLLIEKDLNIDEGMELVEKALELQPENFNFLHTKGLGLYKQGKYNEALEILQRSWDLRREFSVYDHEAFLHLEAAKKAVDYSDSSSYVMSRKLSNRPRNR